LEQQILSRRWGFNVVAPFGYNSNAEQIAHGGTETFEWGAFGDLSWATPVGELPQRVSVNALGELYRYTQAPDVNVDRVGGSARLQYVAPNNDQAFSPFVAIAPRWVFANPLSNLQETREDFQCRLQQTVQF